MQELQLPRMGLERRHRVYGGTAAALAAIRGSGGWVGKSDGELGMGRFGDLASERKLGTQVVSETCSSCGPHMSGKLVAP
jgi:hypothetical protein